MKNPLHRQLHPKKLINPSIRATDNAAAKAIALVQARHMYKQPKFFCENCNAEVRRDAVVCPHCGRFFASVRCPSCGFTGMHREFKNGCPSCGYAFSSDTQINKSSSAKKRKRKKLWTGKQHDTRKSSTHMDTDPLPLWIYGLVLLLGTVLAALFFMY